MVYRVFTWKPSFGPQGEIGFRTQDAQFDDGYEQSVGEGINNRAQSWPLTFRGQSAEIEPIKQFLDDHKGYRLFEWTPPLGAAGLYKVKRYNVTPIGVDYYSLTASFEERFAP